MSIPTLLTDLTDYVDPATLACGGTATTAAPLTVPDSTPVRADNLTFTSLTHCDGDGAEALNPLVAGMFLIVTQVTMSDTAPFAGKNCSFSVLVNGVAIGTITADASILPWSSTSSYTQRLVIGDAVAVSAANPGGSSGLEAVTFTATFTIYRIGP